MRHPGPMPTHAPMMDNRQEESQKPATEPKFGSWEEDAWQMVKLGQRQSGAFKEAWQRWCLDHCDGGRPVFDPAKHPQDFIKGFLDALGKTFLQNRSGGGFGAGKGGYDGFGGKGGYEAGYGKGGGYGGPYTDFGGFSGKGGKGAPARLGSTPPPSLVQLVKASQRIHNLRESWAAYVEDSGLRYNDPSRQAPGFILGFVIHYALDFTSADFFGPLASRLEMDGVTAVLRHLVKVGQKSSSGWKDAWQSFCDDTNNGFRDPHRTDIKTVLQFLQTVAKDYQDEQWYSAALN